MRLLYVEDEPALLQVTAKRLKAEGYGVDTCANGTEALDYIALTDYDAVILDIMLPGRDGLSILREMRAQGNHTPVLLLTARDTVADRVAGLDTGADDYLVKPFSFEELSARIRVLLRRTAQEPVSNLLQLADLTMDLNTRRSPAAIGKLRFHKRNTRCSNICCATKGLCSRVTRSSSTYGATILRAAAMWWMFISVMYAKRLIQVMGKN